MRRFVAALACCALLVGCGDDGDGEPAGMTIAFLRAVPGTSSTEPAMLAELRRAGFDDGRNLTVLGGDPEEIHPEPEDAAAAVRAWRDEGVDLVVALSSSGARAAADAAPELDVLFLSNDPTATGLVSDEAAPEGHLTGATFRVPADRTLSLAMRVIPDLERVGLAYPPADPAALANLDSVQQAADALGLSLVTAEFTDGSDVAGAVERLAAGGVQALILSTSPVATRAAAETAAAATRHELPVIANSPVAQFAVVTLAPDSVELGRQLGRQAARLLTGAEPSTVPVENPTHFRLVLNRAAAASLGITLPDDLLREADEVTG